MISKFERLMAFRYLRSRRKEGFISVIAWFSLLGICLGVATLIIVMSVMNGFRQELLDRILGLNAHVTVSYYGLPIEQYKTVASEIAKIEGVSVVTPTIEGQVMATANGNSGGVVVRGITQEDLRNKEIISSNIRKGSIDAFTGNNRILIGTRLAASMGIREGDKITLISPKTNATVFGAIPRLKEYEVAGMFEMGMYEYDSSVIFMPLGTAQTYFKYPDSVNRIEVLLDNADGAPEISKELFELLDGKYSVVDWKRANAHFFNSLKVERNVMFLILTLIILVAAFNIISSMIMLVNDKSKAIAILRTMGATKSSIMRIFILTGAAIGVVGTALGFLLGYGFAKNIDDIKTWIESFSDSELFAAEVYFLSNLPAIVDMTEVITVVGMSLVLTFLATIYPAWKASSIDPADGVRYE